MADALDKLAQSFGKSLSGAFDRNLNAGRQLDGLLGTLASKLSTIAVKAATTPIRAGLTSAFKGLLGSLTGADESSAFARGGVLERGRVRPFAGGGIVAAPTYFPLGNGGLGLMGEAGPEAILPLRRGSDGRLGVASGTAERPLAVTVNIATSDADSFRRSEAQVAASLARAVARGRRAL